MITYKVQYGDTLHTIARRFETCSGMLIMSNNIPWPYQIFEGQELLIPITAQNEAFAFRSSDTENDMKAINKIFSQESTISGGVLKYSFPRSDLKVRIDNILVDPNLALTSWAAINLLGGHSMLLGDLVLLENEVGPVMSSLFENGIDVTALHNHLMHELPRIMYLHIKGEGDPIKLAQAVRAAISLTATPFKAKQAEPASQTDWSLVENIIGRKGSHKGNVLQLSFPRAITISEDGHPLPPAMGISHGVNFQALTNKAAATGDFVLLADEVNPVAKLLKKNNISVTAVHNHMLTETPRLFFMHFWAVDKPEHLARTLRAVVNLAK